MRILAAIGLGVAALVMPSAAWAGTSEVSAYGCYLEGGQVNRPAGTELVVKQGWSASNRGLAEDFRQAQTTTISLNGGPPVDVSAGYDIPHQEGSGWVTRVFYRTGITLVAGQTVTFHFTATISHTVYDGVAFASRGTVMDFTCAVTGV
jgi:hypothetical protein